MINATTLSQKALLLEGELKRSTTIAADHQALLGHVAAHGGNQRDILELAAFTSTMYQNLERILLLCMEVYELTPPSTLQHHEALIDSAQRAHKNIPGLVAPEAVPGLRQLCRFHYAHRHLKPSELEAREVTVAARTAMAVWDILKPWYKELYLGWKYH